MMKTFNLSAWRQENPYNSLPPYSKWIGGTVSSAIEGCTEVSTRFYTLEYSSSTDTPWNLYYTQTILECTTAEI